MLPIRFIFSGSKVESYASKKFTTCKFASAVIFRPNCSKTLWSSFLVLSAKRADLLLIIAKPSFLYKPMFFLPNFFPRWFKMKIEKTY